MKLVLLLLVIGSAVGRLLYRDFETSEIVSEHSKLMNNQHIVMMGDSLMRYQYLSLVHLVHTDSFVQQDSHPNMLWEKDFNNFSEFYSFTSEKLKPNEYCDCSRSTEFRHDTYENRYYHDSERNISISYFQYMGDTQPKCEKNETGIGGKFGPL